MKVFVMEILNLNSVTKKDVTCLVVCELLE